MSYTISPVLGSHVDKSGSSKVYLRIIYDRKKIEVPIGLKIPPENFEDGRVVKHKLKVLYNNRINEERHNLDSILVGIRKQNISKEELKELLMGKEVKEEKSNTLVDFIYDTCDNKKGKWSDGFIDQQHSIANKLSKFSPDITLEEITVSWLQSFEKHLRESGIKHNTAASNMKNLKIILRIAQRDDLIDIKQFARYETPVEIRPLPTSLTEEEIDRFEEAMWSFNNISYTTAGMYFLFACRAGFRISDAISFNYNTMVVRDTIVLRAKKNKTVVSIPIYPKLGKILEWIKDNRFEMSRSWGNARLKQIAKRAKIDKNISFHVGRHSFAQGLSDKGFLEEEVAAQLGDSKDIAKVYATISNSRLERKYRELMY